MNRKVVALIVAIFIVVIIVGVIFAISNRENSRTNNSSSGETINNTVEVGEDRLVFINGGSFEMGSPETEMQRETDETQHEVTVSDFYIGKYEVTQSEYEEVMGENPSNFSGDNLPVENVTWYDAIEYCNKLSEREELTPVYTIDGENVSWDRSANGYRLPTEAEWEYAARAETTTPFNTENSISDEEAKNSENILIAYFSWSGNTENAAEIIQGKTGADVIELNPVEPYSSNYNEVLDQAQEDMNHDARPELANHVDNMEQYDTILLGYPNWWATIPMPIASFLEEYDFSGKTIIPFCSHGGGGFGQSITDISKLAPNSKIGEGLSIHYSGGSGLENDISDWLSNNGIEEQ